jgi:Holliday junction DNA helicase RuvA
MITRITGLLNRVLDDEVRLQVGAFEYQVLVPEFVRRTVQHRLGQELTLHTSHFYDGDPSRGKVVPRLVGFQSEHELDFFELFCTVNGVGTRKALKALARPIRDIADAIQRQDAKYLTTLPGVGGPTAEKIVATLRRKVTRFALAPAPRVSDDGQAEAADVPTVEGNVLDDAYQALLGLGHGPAEARALLDRALTSGKTFSSIDEILVEIYNRK